MKRRTDDVDKFMLDNESMDEFAFDSETTGLHSYQGHRPFSIQISSEVGDYYFTDKSRWLDVLNFINRKGNLLYAHNAKFDLHMIYNELGFEFDKAVVWCTLAMERLISNTDLKYDLYSVTKRHGISVTHGENTEKLIKLAIEKIKTDRNEERKAEVLKRATELAHKDGQVYKTKKALEEAIKPFKALLEADYATTKISDITYADIPDDIMYPYAIEDTRINLILGQSQRKILSNEKLRPVRDLELKVTRVLFDIEKTGIKLDIDYCIRNAEKLEKRAAELVKEISTLGGIEWKDSYVANGKLFTNLGHPVPKSFDKNSLPRINHPIVKLILEHRTVTKVASTYFRGFVEMAGLDGKLHVNFTQNVSTGRMSASQPNLQNIKKGSEESDPESEAIAVKEALVVPSDDYYIIQADYSAQEYRLAFDIAEEMGLIQKVKLGLDIHTATAEFLSEATGKVFDRKMAKTINFLLLYGGGNQKLADSLKISLNEAKELKETYFSQLPNIQRLVEEVRNDMIQNRYVESWLGRRFQFHSFFLTIDKISDEDMAKYPEWKREKTIAKGGTFIDNSNSAFNATIQGGSSEITKIALVNMHKYLKDNNNKSKIILTVHDAIYIQMHKDELHLVKVLKDTMVAAYPHKHLPMAVEITWGRNLYEERPIKELIG